MTMSNFRQRMLSGEILAGTFVKTAVYKMVEVLAMSGLDFICLDGEHAPFDRARLDACLAVARALDFPVLVRVGSGTPENILQALDSGATGIVVPHVDSVEKAQEMARLSRFGHGGRGYAGSTRWAGFATRAMPDLLEKSQQETCVIVQIEEPEGVEDSAAIAAVDGVDGLFIGPADLTVAHGAGPAAAEQLAKDVATVGAACKENGKAYMSFVPTPEAAKPWKDHGMTVFFLASEQAWMLQGARAAAKGIHDLRD